MTVSIAIVHVQAEILNGLSRMNGRKLSRNVDNYLQFYKVNNMVHNLNCHRSENVPSSVVITSLYDQRQNRIGNMAASYLEGSNIDPYTNCLNCSLSWSSSLNKQE